METVLLVARAGINLPFFPIRYKPSIVFRNWSKLTVSLALDMSMVEISAEVDQENSYFLLAWLLDLPQAVSIIIDKAARASGALILSGLIPMRMQKTLLPSGKRVVF